MYLKLILISSFSGVNCFNYKNSKRDIAKISQGNLYANSVEYFIEKYNCTISNVKSRYNITLINKISFESLHVLHSYNDIQTLFAYNNARNDACLPRKIR